MIFNVKCVSIVIILFIYSLHEAASWNSQNFVRSFSRNLKHASAAALATAALTGPSLLLPVAPAAAVIAPIADVGVREFLVKDGKQFLRLTVPLGKAQKFGSSAEALDMKTAQENLELVKLRFEQVGFTNPTAWGAALKDVNTAATIVKSGRGYLVDQSRDGRAAQQLFDEQLVPQLGLLVEAVRARDIEATLKTQDAAAQTLADLRVLQLPAAQLPFAVPDEYSGLPRLLGRATVQLQLASSSKAGYRLPDGKTVVQQIPLTLVVDGYTTPLTAGNFVDLVNKKFYDNMPLQRVEQQLIQTGKPLLKGAAQGYVDPATGRERTVPLELFYKADAQPVYGVTSDDDMRATETFAHPFQSYGALGMARDNEDAGAAAINCSRPAHGGFIIII